MLSTKTLRILTVLSGRDKAIAEQSAAAAMHRRAALDNHARTLATYAAGLGGQMIGDAIQTGYDLRAYGQFIEMTVDALNQNDLAIEKNTMDQQAALADLGVKTERHKAVLETRDRSAAEVEASRENAHASLVGGGVSRVSGKAGRIGAAPPFARQASRRHT